MKPEELLALRPKKPVFDEVESKSVAGRSRSYKVRNGDNLTLIAKANKVDVHDLQRWNKLNGQALKVGQTLVMQDTRKLVAKADSKKPVQYKVKKGDSLYIVAKRFNVEMQHLKRWNHALAWRSSLGRCWWFPGQDKPQASALLWELACCDADTEVYQLHQVSAIAGKPTPTFDLYAAQYLASLLPPFPTAFFQREQAVTVPIIKPKLPGSDL